MRKRVEELNKTYKGKTISLENLELLIQRYFYPIKLENDDRSNLSENFYWNFPKNRDEEYIYSIDVKYHAVNDLNIVIDNITLIRRSELFAGIKF